VTKQKAQSAGTTSNSSGKADSAGAERQGASDSESELAAQDEQDDDAADDDDEEGDLLVEALVGLMQMDLEAATAYEIAAEIVGLPQISGKLMEFAGDHRRHVEALTDLLEEFGYELDVAVPDPEASTFANLASSMSSIGIQAGVMALIGNEEFTNSTYQTTLGIVDEPQLRTLLERHLQDEQRHLKWLVSNKETAWEAESSEGAPRQRGAS
jgi:rubrerythrin